MIAIYDQGKDAVIFTNYISLNDDDIKEILIDTTDNEGDYSCARIGKYESKAQAQHVLNQIASAIKRGDKLFEMPSTREVQRALDHEEMMKNASCANCDNSLFSKENKQSVRCMNCQNKSWWTPKGHKPCE